MLRITNYATFYLDKQGKSRVKFNSWKDFVKDWLNLDVNEIKSSRGVYLFGGFYIGSTESLSSRIYQHCQLALTETHSNKKFTEKFNQYIFSGTPMPVEILSLDVAKENYYIEKYKPQLINQLRGNIKTPISRGVAIMKQVEKRLKYLAKQNISAPHQKAQE